MLRNAVTVLPQHSLEPAGIYGLRDESRVTALSSEDHVDLPIPPHAGDLHNSGGVHGVARSSCLHHGKHGVNVVGVDAFSAGLESK